jgi:HAD superfamily hydrolase (TIGR01509 family)
MAAGERLAAEGALPLGSWQDSPGELAIALSSLLGELVDEAHRASPLREVDLPSVEREALGRLLGAAPSRQLAERLGAAVQRAWGEGVVPVEPARRVLASLSEGGVRLGLLSNAPYPAYLMNEQLERLGLRRFFEVTLFSSEVGWRKPSARAFAELLRRLGLPGSAVWFVGDEWEADIEGARAAGMRAILAPGAAAGEMGADQLRSWDELLPPPAERRRGPRGRFVNLGGCE